MTLTTTAGTAGAVVTSSTRLLVTVRDSAEERYRAVGFLSSETNGFTFAYFRRELDRPGFRPLPGLRAATHGAVASADLFPVFAERVMSARRPDRMDSLAALGLDPSAAPFEILHRSQGRRVGDTIELIAAPDPDPGQAVSFMFLTHGVRHLGRDASERIAALRTGERLRLLPEIDNPYDVRAQLVTDMDQVRLGWVPAPLLDVLEQVTDCELAVARANGPQVGFHFRLLVKVTATLPAGAQRLFSGPDWLTVR